MRTCVEVSDLIHLDRAGEGDTIAAWTSATTSILRRNSRTSTGTAWQRRKSKTCCGGPWRIDRDEKERGSRWVGPKRDDICA
jgi:hypothetical protein